MKTASVRGTEIAHEVTGTGPVILCIHGFPLSHRLWLPTAERLADRFKFVLPDLRGLGTSPATADASMADYADDLAALLDTLSISEPVAVMGLSMGGYVAFEFFRRHTARVRTLILADTQALPDTAEKAKSRRQGAEEVLAEGNRKIVDAMTPNLFGPDTPKQLVDEWRKFMLATDPRGTAAAMRAMADRADSRPIYASINVPTLVVVGEKDAITPPDVALDMSSGIPGAKLEIIPGVGHMSPVEAPDEYARIVANFLDSIAG